MSKDVVNFHAFDTLTEEYFIIHNRTGFRAICFKVELFFFRVVNINCFHSVTRDIIFEVLMTLTMKMAVFGSVTCNLVDVYLQKFALTSATNGGRHSVSILQS
jgi:hypothetical protein